jgi:hypothetical protein
MNSKFTDEDYQNASVSLHRGPCFGPCPIYTVTVQGNGWISYKGEGFVQVEGKQESFIEPKAAQELILTFAIQDFFSYARNYDEFNGMTDLPHTDLILSIGGTTKTASRYGLPPNYPKRLIFLENEIERVANVKQWVGESED